MNRRAQRADEADDIQITGDGACIRAIYLDQAGNTHCSITHTTQASADLFAFAAEVRQAFDLMHSALGLELISLTVGVVAGQPIEAGAASGAAGTRRGLSLVRTPEA